MMSRAISFTFYLPIRKGILATELNSYMYMRFILILLPLMIFAIDASAQSFANAKYGGDFLSVGAGARALGMGSAHAAITNDVTSAYWNPAGLTDVESLDIAYMHSERFAGIVS